MNDNNEIEFVIQYILPLLTRSYDFPDQEDHEHVKIQSVPVRMGSGIKKPDVVYYYDGIPIFLVESKREGRPKEDAIQQALSYIRNFPVKDYSKDYIRPRYFAVTIGKEINFYIHKNELLENGAIKDWYEDVEPIDYKDLKIEYGLVSDEINIIDNPEEFRSQVLNELAAIYKLDSEKITSDTIKKVSLQILNYLRYGSDYTAHRPYTDIEHKKDRQAQIRQVFKQYDIAASIGPALANEFRRFILRSFQGTNLNQYLTEKCVIDFMVNLISGVNKESKVLDFECGSGGFLASALKCWNTDLENIRGVDIDELPFIISKTFLAIYFKITGSGVDSIPIKNNNGLFPQGSDWDVVLSNPSGGNYYPPKAGEKEDQAEIDKKYQRDKVLEYLDADLDNNERSDKFSQYNFSVQQAVRSAKVGGKICLLLPEGLFSNSQDEFLRKFVAKYCKVLAIISLPRGVFKKGTDTSSMNAGSQGSNQKMSILFAQKICELDKSAGIELDAANLEYPIFLASVSDAESNSGNIEDWLEPKLHVVLDQWKEWQMNGELLRMEKSPYKLVISKKKTENDSQMNLLEAPEKTKADDEKQKVPEKRWDPKSNTTISDWLSGLFK